MSNGNHETLKRSNEQKKKSEALSHLGKKLGLEFDDKDAEGILQHMLSSDTKYSINDSNANHTQYIRTKRNTSSFDANITDSLNEVINSNILDYLRKRSLCGGVLDGNVSSDEILKAVSSWLLSEDRLSIIPDRVIQIAGIINNVLSDHHQIEVLSENEAVLTLIVWLLKNDSRTVNEEYPESVFMEDKEKVKKEKAEEELQHNLLDYTKCNSEVVKFLRSKGLLYDNPKKEDIIAAMGSWLFLDKKKGVDYQKVREMAKIIIDTIGVHKDIEAQDASDLLALSAISEIARNIIFEGSMEEYLIYKIIDDKDPSRFTLGSLQEMLGQKKLEDEGLIDLKNLDENKRSNFVIMFDKCLDNIIPSFLFDLGINIHVSLSSNEFITALTGAKLVSDLGSNDKFTKEEIESVGAALWNRAIDTSMNINFIPYSFTARRQHRPGTIFVSYGCQHSVAYYCCPLIFINFYFYFLLGKC